MSVDLYLPSLVSWSGVVQGTHLISPRGVNCTGRHEERQAPGGYHKCETGSKFIFVDSGWR